MVHSDDLSHVYAENMAHHPYGYAMYKPVSSNILKPGSCGYFDSLGTWNPFVDLTSPSSLQKYGLSSPKEELERIPSEENTDWGPKVSRSVTEARLDLSGGLGYVYDHVALLSPSLLLELPMRQEYWPHISLWHVKFQT
jgi:hypothetical protein